MTYQSKNIITIQIWFDLLRFGNRFICVRLATTADNMMTFFLQLEEYIIHMYSVYISYIFIYVCIMNVYNFRNLQQKASFSSSQPGWLQGASTKKNKKYSTEK